MDEKGKKIYTDYVESVTPTHNVWLQMLKAYIVGGVICVLGQGINHLVTELLEVDKDTAATIVSISLILTGLKEKKFLKIFPILLILLRN